MKVAHRPWRPAMAVQRARVGRALARPLCLALLALATTSCLDDGATGPATGPARLSVNASVNGAAARAVTALAVRVDYLRDSQGPALLTEQEIPLGDVAPGGSVTRPLNLELGPCLADADHLPGAGSCRVMVQVTLLAGAQSLDVVTIGPLDLRPGQTAEPQAVTLRAAATLSISPASPAPLYPGDRVQLQATLTDATGQVVGGRDVEWTSSAGAVATVGADGGVTAVAPGSAVISAAAGGRTATANVTVVARPSIKLAATSIAFSARRATALPDQATVGVVNGAAGTLTGITLGAIAYEGGATGWLQASLAGSTAPTTLSLRPSTTNLAPGRYSASVPVNAPGASNSGAAVRVTYEVLPVAVLTLSESSVELEEGGNGRRVGVTTSISVSRLDLDVTYHGMAGAWLEARMEGDDILLGPGSGASQLGPGRYTATVSVSAPEAATPATLDVSYVVDPDDFYFYVYQDPSESCISPQSQAKLYPELYRYPEVRLTGIPVTMRILDPGVRFQASMGTLLRTVTGDSVVLVHDPSFSGDGLVLVLTTLDSSPEEFSDSLYVGVSNGPECYFGSPRRTRPLDNPSAWGSGNLPPSPASAPRSVAMMPAADRAGSAPTTRTSGGAR